MDRNDSAYSVEHVHIPLNRSTQFTHLIGADLLLLTIWLKEFTQFTYLITAFSCLCPFHWRDSLSLHLWSQHSPVSVHFIEGIHSVYTFEQSSSSAFDHFIKGIHSVYTFWAEQFSCLSSFHGTDCLDLHIWSEQFSWHICFIERINAVRKFLSEQLSCLNGLTKFTHLTWAVLLSMSNSWNGLTKVKHLTRAVLLCPIHGTVWPRSRTWPGQFSFVRFIERIDWAHTHLMRTVLLCPFDWSAWLRIWTHERL